MFGILWAVFIIILIVWAIGFAVHIAGAFIHILLILALIVLLYNLFFGSRSRRRRRL